jgi:hypothetical protein
VEVCVACAGGFLECTATSGGWGGWMVESVPCDTCTVTLEKTGVAFCRVTEACPPGPCLHPTAISVDSDHEAENMTLGFWACELPPAIVVDTNPVDRHSLWRSQKNIMRFRFDNDIIVPVPGQIEIVECQPDCAEGDDQSPFFDISIEDQGSGPRVLRLQDTDLTPMAGHLKHRSWYKVRSKAWACVEPFEFQFVVLYGNADDTLFVDNTDLSVINRNFGFYPGVDDLRFDINGDFFVDNQDMSIANDNFSGFLPKPCCP